MELFEYFSEDYKFISATGSEEYEAIDDFLEDADEGKERKYPEPLKAVFIHNTKSEIFLVFNCLDYDLEAIKSICEEWERKIICFINFGKEYRDRIPYLKYEISLIILCKNDKGSIDDNFRFETEKSLKICRKIFLFCNTEGKINEDDRPIIPFYLAPVEKIDNKETEELEKKLENLLPNEDAEMISICKNEELTPDDIKKICGWLSKNDNN